MSENKDKLINFTIGLGVVTLFSVIGALMISLGTFIIVDHFYIPFRVTWALLFIYFSWVLLSDPGDEEDIS